MKKIILILLIILINTIGVSAKAEEKVEGLKECIDSLFMTNYFSEEEIAQMDKEYMEYYSDYLLNNYLPARKYLGRLKTGSIEEDYELEMKEGELDFDNAIKVSQLYLRAYAQTYAQNGKLEQLFMTSYYWAVPEKNGTHRNRGHFSEKGENITFPFKDTSMDYESCLIDQESIDMVRDISTIENMLLEQGENKVLDMKLFCIREYLQMLYIKTDKKEYLVRLSKGKYDGGYKIEYHKLYNPDIIIDEIIRVGIVNVNEDKPTFDTEAESLQAEGLLNGNENGLDLLKPLTRIEAAAMLLRAMGESEDSTGETVFSDVPLTHWGNGAANKAHSLGIIKGIGDNQFAPDKQVSAEQFSTMVLRAANISDFDWKEALNILIEKGIITSENSKTMDFFTRGDMAKIIYEARAKGFLN